MCLLVGLAGGVSICISYLTVVGKLGYDLLPGLEPLCLKVHKVAVEIGPTRNLGRENETLFK